MRLKDHWLLKSGKVHRTLHDISMDDSDPDHIEYMTESKAVVIDFDLVKRVYMNNLGMSENDAKSVDALFQASLPSSGVHSDICMLEFKNGGVENRDIERKVRDSVLILQSITGTQLEDTRKHVCFVLVYT